MKRDYDYVLTNLLTMFPCVAIIGPRQCGKTTLLKTLPKAWRRFDLERIRDHQTISCDPDLFLRLHPRHIAIDGVQYLPELLPALGAAINAEPQTPGRFVISMSGPVDYLYNASGSLSQRIGIMEIAPFAWAETHRLKSWPSFAMRFSNPQSRAADFETLRPRDSLESVHKYWFTGGFPKLWTRNTDRFRTLWMDRYIRNYLFEDVARHFPGLDQKRFQRFTQMLAGLSGTIINYSEIGRALGVSAPTAREYCEITNKTFFWRKIPPYEKNLTKRIVKHPKGHL